MLCFPTGNSCLIFFFFKEQNIVQKKDKDKEKEIF